MISFTAKEQRMEHRCANRVDFGLVRTEFRVLTLSADFENVLNPPLIVAHRRPRRKHETLSSLSIMTGIGSRVCAVSERSRYSIRFAVARHKRLNPRKDVYFPSQRSLVG